ncbi:phage late control D family protein [Haliangium ochraceum]|uniref:Putative phage late control gene D protein n=1 Tax=Haliangium ochraceum (strain DSM 14365 / JCM 11303 / SMP-2) TaxID=502025 RepID=D0LLS6_HALO1|nr:contractile injection system protein, VgrG/Pvc8 family [Haliangium ochraceum]ACY13293.1 putative phage late control gene D protein [Haliangium ochraceum DSM 14365]
MTIRDRSKPGVRIARAADAQSPDSEPLDLAGRVLGLVYEDGEDKADKVSLQLENADLALFDRADLAGGTILDVSWGYPGAMAPPRRVVVKKLKGFATLTVEGRALSTQMHRAAKTRSWTHVRRAEVARRIAREHGYEGVFADIEDTGETFETISQSGETDARFLRRLAAREGVVFFADDSGFHFHARRQDAPPARVFTWYADPGRGDVVSVHVESDLGRRVGRVTVRGRDPMRRQTIEASATGDSTARTTLGDVIEVVDPETGATSLETRNATASVHAGGATTAQRAQRESDARFRQAEREAVKLSLHVVGDPALRAKTVVEVRGISTRLSGKYYVKTVRHVLSSSGYLCELALERDGTGRQDPKQRPQGGTRNTAQAPAGGAMTLVELVDRETGATALEYRRDGRPLGAGDPEGQP